MQTFARAIILALALAVGNAGSAPSVSMNVKQSKIGSGVSMDSLGADFQVQSQVSDDLSVGVNLDNSGSPLKSMFAKINQKLGGGNVNADLTMDMKDNSIAGDVTYTEGDNNIEARVSSGVDNFVERIRYSRSGAGWTFKPSFNMQDRNMDLEASADYSDDTNVAVRMNADGNNNLAINHRLNADTSVSLEGSNLDLGAMTAEVNHRLDANTNIKVSGVNTKMDALRLEVAHQLDADTKVTPTFDMNSKHATVSVNRRLDGGRSLNVDLDMDNSMKVEVAGANDEDWTASVSSPWGDFPNADIAVGRKFNF